MSDLGCCGLEHHSRAFIAVMSSTSSAVTYTSVYTDSEPGRPVAPPSPDYIPDSEEPQTPPVPQDEDEPEPMFIQPHDPDYVPEPIYPEYIPLEDEHEFLSDPEEDLEEYEDDETDDGPVDYPMDGGEDGDDDDGDSSGDDADDKDEEDEEEEDEEEEHLAPAYSAVIVPTVELVSPPEGTEPDSISLPPEAEVERLLAMPTPPPSPLTSLSPPSAGDCLARCMARSAHSSPPPVPSPLLLLSRCPTQIQTLRIASTQALVDAVIVALPSPLLPPLPPSLYIPPPVDRRDDVPEAEQPPRKRSCLFALGSRYEVGESSTGRPIEGQGTQHQVHETHSQMQQAEMAELRETDRRHQAQMIETLRMMRDMRREMGDMQAELLALREQRRRARQPAPDARVPDHQDTSRDADSHI
ncbi:hypothetical protein Tco_1107039 [Tanacetum coccineum]